MNLPMYNNARKLHNKPNDHYLTQVQALINDRWENGTQTSHNIYQETGIGTREYRPVDISVDTAIDIGTGFKKGDDFKVFSHRDISHEVQLGTMFKSANDYWVCINTNGFASPTNSCEVRRCNNILKWVDRHTGYVHEQWCAIDYELSSPSAAKDKDIIVARGHIFVIVQGNEETLAIEKNQRFIFNGEPYKLDAVQTMLNDSATTPVDTLLYMDLYRDPAQPTDDLVNNIANATEYIYKINLQPDVDSQLNAFTGKIVADVTFNGQPVDRELVWWGNKYVSVEQDGSYTLVGKDGDEAVISVQIHDNPDSLVTHTITIVDAIADDFDIVIEPTFDEVRYNLPQTFSAYLYNNGVKQSDDVSCVATGLSDDYFTLIQNDHEFTLRVDKWFSGNLDLTFSAGNTTETISVTLKPFF